MVILETEQKSRQTDIYQNTRGSRAGAGTGAGVGARGLGQGSGRAGAGVGARGLGSGSGGLGGPVIGGVTVRPTPAGRPGHTTLQQCRDKERREHDIDGSLTATLTELNDTLLGRRGRHGRPVTETVANRAARRQRHGRTDTQTEATNDMIFVPDKR